MAADRSREVANQDLPCFRSRLEGVSGVNFRPIGVVARPAWEVSFRARGIRRPMSRIARMTSSKGTTQRAPSRAITAAWKL